MLFESGDWTNEGFPCEILYRLRGGHMAELYVAKLRSTQHLVVLKAVSKDGLAQSFLRREAEILKKLRLDGIPEFYGCFEDAERIYYIMSYHKGMNLEEYVQKKGCMTEMLVQEIALEICRILAYLHSDRISVVHNDLKPANLLLQEDGSIVLLDFGLAEYLRGNKEKLFFQGTLGYAAPECWHRDAQKMSPATDIFSLGATLFYLLEGREPKDFYGKFWLGEGDAQKKNRWQTVLNKCCALDIQKRYQSAAEVYEVLRKTNC